MRFQKKSVQVHRLKKLNYLKEDWILKNDGVKFNCKGNK